MAKVNVDLAARRALQQNEGVRKMTAEEILEILEPCMWNLLVEPLKPKEETSGGIILVQEAQQAQEVNTTTALVLACGPTAFDGKTNSGIVLKDLTPKIQKASDLVGKYISFQKFTGQIHILIDNDDEDRKVIVMTNTEVLCIVHKPERIRHYL